MKSPIMDMVLGGVLILGGVRAIRHGRGGKMTRSGGVAVLVGSGYVLWGVVEASHELYSSLTTFVSPLSTTVTTVAKNPSNWLIAMGLGGLLVAVGIWGIFKWRKSQPPVNPAPLVVPAPPAVLTSQPGNFIDYVAVLFEKQGYQVTQQGMDLHLQGNNRSPSLVQCLQTPPTTDALRSLVGAMALAGVTRGYLVSDGVVPPDVATAARVLSGYTVVLIDGDELARKEQQLGMMPNIAMPVSSPLPMASVADAAASRVYETSKPSCIWRLLGVSLTVLFTLILTIIGIGGGLLLLTWLATSENGWGVVMFLVVVGLGVMGFISEARATARRKEVLLLTRNLYSLGASEFEEYVGLLFERHGYQVQRSGGRGDRGVDLRISKDGQRGIVQCKRYAPDRQKQRGNRVGPDIVREFYGTMMREGIAEGYIVTTSSFTSGAKQEVRSLHRGKINLVDGAELSQWAKTIGLPGEIMWRS